MIDHRVSAGRIDSKFPLLSSSPPAPAGRGKTAAVVGADKERPSGKSLRQLNREFSSFVQS
jgi:hypothetical protein